MGTEYIAVGFTILFTIATSALLGGYMFKVFTGRRTLLDPVFVPIERLVLRLTGVDPNSAAGLEAVLGVPAGLEHCHVAGHICVVIAAEGSADQSRRHRQHGADARLQHDLELRDEHEPAALQRRDGPLVLLADVRHQLSAVRDRRDGHCGRRRRHPGPGRQSPDAARQLLRRPHARDVPGLSAAGAAGVGPGDVAGHADDVRGRCQGDDGRRTGADDCSRRDRRRRVDQTAGHERRRLLRPEFDASVRESRRRWPTSSRPGRSRSSRCRWW